MRIPPPGSDAGAIAEYVDKLVREAAMDPRRRDWEGEGIVGGGAVEGGAATTTRAAGFGEAERGYNLYLGNHFQTATPAGSIRVVLNRISNCIMALVAIQAGDPPQITFTGRESGEPPLVFVNDQIPEGQILATRMQSMSQAAGHPWQATDPLPPEVVQSIQQEIAQGQQLKSQAMAMGMSEPQGIMPPEVLAEVSDRTAAEALQTIFDAIYESGDIQYIFAENVLNKNIFGLQSTLYEWDDENRRPVLTNVHPKQVFFDPLRSTLARCQYVIYDEPISADEAVSLYPHLEPKIREHFTEGSPRVPGSRPYDPAYRYQTVLYREWGFIRHCWIRSQPYPMTPEQGENCGKLDCRDVPDERIDDIGDPSRNNPLPQGSAAFAASSGVSGDLPTLPGGDQADSQAVGGAVPPGAMAAIPQAATLPTRKAYFPTGSDQEIPAPVTDPITGKVSIHPLWPMRYSVRKIKVVASEAVEDRESENGIPLPTNINIPVPYSMYGMGEPVRLEGVQMALNYVLSGIVTWQRYNAYPPEVVLESIVDMMDEGLRKARSRPNQRIVVPDAVLNEIKSLKDVIVTLDPPTLPADFWKLLQFLVDMIDKEGNQSDVMSGNAAPGWSGDAIDSLQNAAANVIRAKSMATEFYLKSLARLIEYDIVNRMTWQDWLAYVSKYPPQAMQALHNRNKTLDRDLSVQIRSGSGASKQAKTNNLIAAKQNGVPISTPTIMEHLDADPDVELAREAEWQKKTQAAGLGVQQSPASPAPSPGAAGGGMALAQPRVGPQTPAGRAGAGNPQSYQGE